MARVTTDHPRTPTLSVLKWFSTRRYGAVLDPGLVAYNNAKVLRLTTTPIRPSCRGFLPRGPANRGSLRVPKPLVLPREGCPMADKSPKKANGKTAAAKSLKEKRADKKAKSSTKTYGA